MARSFAPVAFLLLATHALADEADKSKRPAAEFQFDLQIVEFAPARLKGASAALDVPQALRQATRTNDADEESCACVKAGDFHFHRVPAAHADQLDALVGALEQSGAGDTIAAPRITTPEGQSLTYDGSKSQPVSDSGAVRQGKHALPRLDITPCLLLDDTINLDLTFAVECPADVRARASAQAGAAAPKIEEIETSLDMKLGETLVVHALTRDACKKRGATADERELLFLITPVRRESVAGSTPATPSTPPVRR